VTWDAPSSDGGSSIMSYEVTAADQTTSGNGGQTCPGTDPATGCTLTGLTDGDSYTFTVTATNGVGTGPASDPSLPVTPMMGLIVVHVREVASIIEFNAVYLGATKASSAPVIPSAR
jgi:hypothetical protein